MVKTTKGGKVMNPTDAYRKELRKKEIKRNKKERKKVREVGLLKKDPDQIKEQIQKLDIMKAEGALDKARKHKKRQLEDTYNMVMKKRKEYEEKLKEKGEEPVMFSHLGPVRHRISAEDEERANHPKPEDSVYYHPTLNPTGAPPPGKPPMYNSSIGPRIPLSEASSSSGAALSSMGPDVDLPAPPPPPPLPKTGDPEFISGTDLPASLPLPPPPPMPPRLPGSNLGGSLPLPPPPPPGPPPREQIGGPPPPPPSPMALQQALQPPPPGTSVNERDSNRTVAPDGTDSKAVQAQNVLPLPPPPPGLPPKPSQDESAAESDAKSQSESKDSSNMVKLPPPPPPPRQPPVPVLAGPVALPTLQPDVLPPGISRFPPPPPPPDMRPSIAAPGVPGQTGPPGMIPLMTRPPYGPPPGPPPMMRPPLPPGPPPMMQPNDQVGIRLTAPQKPSFVKSAAPTVIKRPLAQHTPELTAMIPASVRVRRESALPKPKPKSSSVSTTTITHQTIPAAPKPEPVNPAAPKGPTIDDSYMAFLEDMKALGALDG